MPLRDHDSGQSSNYLDAEEVVELLHVCHLELIRAEGLDLVDVVHKAVNAEARATF